MNICLCTEELATLLGEGEGDLPRAEPGGRKQPGVGRGKGEEPRFLAVGWAAETGRG